jgi:hypothetical protein
MMEGVIVRSTWKSLRVSNSHRWCNFVFLGIGAIILSHGMMELESRMIILKGDSSLDCHVVHVDANEETHI